MKYDKPDDFDSGSKKDQDDYNRLMAAFPGTEIIPMKTLKRVSTRVLGEVSQRYGQILLDEAHEDEYQEMHQPSMKEKIQALLDKVEQDLPDGCQGMNCSTCPLRNKRNGKSNHLCAALIAQMHHR